MKPKYSYGQTVYYIERSGDGLTVKIGCVLNAIMARYDFFYELQNEPQMINEEYLYDNYEEALSDKDFFYEFVA